MSLYKQLMRLAKETKAPTGQLPYVEQLKAGFRQHMLETNEEAVNSLISKAKSKLGFLLVVAPRRKGAMAAGKQNFVFRQGEGLVQTNSVRSRKTTFRDDRIDPDDLARHQRLLEYEPLFRRAIFHPSCLDFANNEGKRMLILDF